MIPQDLSETNRKGCYPGGFSFQDGRRRKSYQRKAFVSGFPLARDYATASREIKEYVYVKE